MWVLGAGVHRWILLDSFVAHSSSDLSIWGLFMMADPLVKAVMLMLVVASIWCWAIIFEKITSVRHERRHSNNFEDAFWSGGSADALYDEIGGDPRDAMTRVFVGHAGMAARQGKWPCHGGTIRPSRFAAQPR